MRSRLFFLFAVLLMSADPSNALSESDLATRRFMLQVASFPDVQAADRFVVQLVHAGEHPLCYSVDLQGRGCWTRIFVGSFTKADEARRYGDRLVARGIIREFLVKKADLNQAVTRPRRVTRGDSYAPRYKTTPVVATLTARLASYEAARSSSAADSRAASGIDRRAQPVEVRREVSPTELRDSAGTPLPVLKAGSLELAPAVDMSLLPRPDPVRLAFKLVAGETRAAPGAFQVRSGLWITGDTAEALARLRWIVGEKDAELIKLGVDGRVQLDGRLLAKAAGLRVARAEDPVQVADYISANEGLLLVVQLAEGGYRYCLHVGRQAPTRGRSVEISGSVNLDNNFDSRINPYRRLRNKLDSERPPEGFDSLVGLNPAARWFNLSAQCWVPVGEITFHELAEAYAKLELGLDYLEQGSRTGAHAVALERERRLKSERPGADIVVTAGSNRVLRNKEEIRLFFAEAPAGASQR